MVWIKYALVVPWSGQMGGIEFAQDVFPFVEARQRYE